MTYILQYNIYKDLVPIVKNLELFIYCVELEGENPTFMMEFTP